MDTTWEGARPWRRTLRVFAWVIGVSTTLAGLATWIYVKMASADDIPRSGKFALGTLLFVGILVASTIFLLVLLRFMREQRREGDAAGAAITTTWKEALVQRTLENEKEAKEAAKKHEEDAKTERTQRENIEAQFSALRTDVQKKDVKLTDAVNTLKEILAMYDKKKVEHEAAEKTIRAVEDAVADSRSIEARVGLLLGGGNADEPEAVVREKIRQARTILVAHRNEVLGIKPPSPSALAEALKGLQPVSTALAKQLSQVGRFRSIGALSSKSPLRLAEPPQPSEPSSEGPSSPSGGA